MPKIDVKKGLNRAKKVVDSTVSEIKKIKFPEIKKEDVKKVVETTQGAIKKKTEEVKKKVLEKKEEKVEDKSLHVLSTKSALQIIRYMIAVDGQVSETEEKQYEEFGYALDVNFDKNKKLIYEDCQKQMDKVIDDIDYYDVIQDAVEKAILDSKPTKDAYITPKLLIWDLLSIVYSDNRYDELERKLMKYLVRKMDVDKAVFLEMESSILTLMDVEKELNWIKTTSRPYLTIEAVVNELLDRRNVILNSVYDLISL